MADGSILMTLLTIGASVGGTLGVTYFGNWLSLGRDKKLKQDDRDRHARYLAIRVVCVLDPFVVECCSAAYEGEETNGGTHASKPITLALPGDVEWKSIDSDLMYRILGFPNEIDISKQAIASTDDDDPDHEAYYEACALHYGALGLEALNIADDIRGRFKIPPRNNGDWNPSEILTKRVATTRERQAKRQAQREAMTKELMKAGKPASVQ